MIRSVLHRRPLTVRERIVAAVIALAALALIAAGGTAWVLQRTVVDEVIDNSLHRSISELKTIANQGVDPATGEAFATADALMYAMMQYVVPAPNEGVIALLEGEVRYRTQDIGVPLASDAEFVAAVAGAADRETAHIDSLTTATRQYRYAALPVRVGDTTGAMVLAFDRPAQLSEVDDTFRTYTLVAIGAVILLAVVAWRLSGRLLLPLRTLREAATQISDTDLSRRIPVTGHDDISSLAATFNAMLDRLETAFASQRQLLDDAGHELRTPLTIVRGHLELMDPNDPDDAAETRALAMSELDRMHRLADDLVMLAKAEAPDFVQPEHAELGPLMDNVLDQAQQLGPRRWRLEPRVEARAMIDAQRTTQALLQLAHNAVKFSGPNSTITFGSEVAADEVRLWVEDEGHGIAEADQERIFERFARVTAPTSREGSGLGLSIVAAIAAGHGGRVSVTSTPGVGSRFTLHLPDDYAEFSGAQTPEIGEDDTEELPTRMAETQE